MVSNQQQSYSFTRKVFAYYTLILQLPPAAIQRWPQKHGGLYFTVNLANLNQCL